MNNRGMIGTHTFETSIHSLEEKKEQNYVNEPTELLFGRSFPTSEIFQRERQLLFWEIKENSLYKSWIDQFFRDLVKKQFRRENPPPTSHTSDGSFCGHDVANAWDFIQPFINSRPLPVKMEISGEHSQAIFTRYETGLIYQENVMPYWSLFWYETRRHGFANLLTGTAAVQFQAELKVKERIFSKKKKKG